MIESLSTIEIRIHRLAELFNPLDPSPLQRRALESSAETYIVRCASERPAPEALHLLICCPLSLQARAAEMVDGIHEHFRRTHARGERQFRRRRRVGTISLGAGLIILAVSVGLRNLLSDMEARVLATGLAEGLLILGWVAMWRPIEILLYEHWESHLDHAVLKRLAGIAVDYSFLPTATRAGAENE